MSLSRRVAAFAAERGLLAPGEAVVVGVSGGVDSVTLLHVLVEAGFRPIAAHVNYGLRGADSEEDEALVRFLCAAWGVPLHVERATLSGSVQAEARRVRYGFFARVAAETGAAKVATAHHRDDQAETLLLHLFRGAGPRGLAGMPVRRPLASGSPVEVVRPLLLASRAEIEAYAREHGLRWREDASNVEGSYRRTALRRDVLPAIEEVFGEDVRERLATTAELLRAFLDSGAALAAGGALDEVQGDLDGLPALSTAALRAMPEVQRRGVLLDALRRLAPDAPRSAATVSEIEALLEAQPGRRVVWPSLTVWRDREHLVFEPGESGAEPFEASVAPGRTETPFGALDVELLPEPPRSFDPSPWVEVVDADRLGFPLALRSWRPGDAFRPLGLEGEKKVSDLLTDRKVPPQERARQLVLLSGGAVVWVVGHRLGEAFGVGPGTRRAARLVWRPAGGVDADRGGR